MPYDEKLADRIREALSGQRKVEEKKMFRGMCFMVNGKMCICVSADDMMCRVDPDLYESLMEQHGVRPMIHNGRTMKGFVYVSPDVIKSKKDFDSWIEHCLEFNKKAKASRKPVKKIARKKK